MNRLVPALLLLLCASAPNALAAKRTVDPTSQAAIDARYAAYHAHGERPPATRRGQAWHGLKVAGARALIRSGSVIGFVLERRSNQRALDTQIAAIVTAGELRVTKLGMDRDDVGREVQRQIDDFRATDPLRVNVPANILGVQ